jgi:hypothetical protein
LGGLERRCASFLLAHPADEPEPFPRHGSDKALLFTVVAERRARGIDAAAQRCLGDDASMPDLGQQLILADHALAVPNQVLQQIEYLRLNPHDHAAAMQLAPVGIQNAIREREQRYARSALAPGRTLPHPWGEENEAGGKPILSRSSSGLADFLPPSMRLGSGAATRMVGVASRLQPRWKITRWLMIRRTLCRN